MTFSCKCRLKAGSLHTKTTDDPKKKFTELLSLLNAAIDQSQSNMRRMIDCNWSISYGVRLTTSTVDDPLPKGEREVMNIDNERNRKEYIFGHASVTLKS